MFILYLPIFAILVHLAQGILYFTYSDIIEGKSGLKEMAVVVTYIVLIMQIVLTLLSFLLTVTIPKKVISNWSHLVQVN